VIKEEGRSLIAPAALLGACLLFGLVVGGWLLGSEIRDIKLADRSVTVKGLVERTVKSDTAIWTMSFKESSDDLKAGYAKAQADQATVLKFLADHGIQGGDIAEKDIGVTDRLTSNVNNSQALKGPRFIVEGTIVVNSKDVDRVERTNAITSDLLAQGIILSTDTTVYKFTGLNALKPDMITEATRNARASAARFAADSGAKVGSIRSASQGVFSITAANEVSTNEDGGFNSDQQADSSIMKKVRVVSTIDYYLLD
jgi:hypothetical protein